MFCPKCGKKIPPVKKDSKKPRCQKCGWWASAELYARIVESLDLGHPELDLPSPARSASTRVIRK